MEPIHLGKVAASQEQPAEPDWKTWEASFNDSTHKDKRLVGASRTCRPPGRQGLNNEILVGREGFEPSTLGLRAEQDASVEFGLDGS